MTEHRAPAMVVALDWDTAPGRKQELKKQRGFSSSHSSSCRYPVAGKNSSRTIFPSLTV